MKSIDEAFKWKFLKAGVVFGILLAGLTYFIPDAKPKTPDEELLLKTCITCYMGYLQRSSDPVSDNKSK
jgi:hypothetical protein